MFVYQTKTFQAENDSLKTTYQNKLLPEWAQAGMKFFSENEKRACDFIASNYSNYQFPKYFRLYELGGGNWAVREIEEKKGYFNLSKTVDVVDNAGEVKKGQSLSVIMQSPGPFFVSKNLRAAIGDIPIMPSTLVSAGSFKSGRGPDTFHVYDGERISIFADVVGYSGFPSLALLDILKATGQYEEWQKRNRY